MPNISVRKSRLRLMTTNMTSIKKAVSSRTRNKESAQFLPMLSNTRSARLSMVSMRRPCGRNTSWSEWREMRTNSWANMRQRWSTGETRRSSKSPKAISYSNTRKVSQISRLTRSRLLEAKILLQSPRTWWWSQQQCQILSSTLSPTSKTRLSKQEPWLRTNRRPSPWSANLTSTSQSAISSSAWIERRTKVCRMKRW